MKFRYLFLFLTGSFLLGSCTEDTGSLGIYESSETIETSVGYYDIYTETCPLDSIESNSMTCFLGIMSDTLRTSPLLVSEVNASFATQIYLPENTTFPNKDSIRTRDPKDGLPTCDSVYVDLLFDNWFGDYDNPLKIHMYRIGVAMEDSDKYYTSTDLFTKLVKDKEPLASKMITPRDYIHSDAELNSSGYLNSVRIPIDVKLGKEVLAAYYEHPEYFRNSYVFNHNVLPGFYFKATGGEQSMYQFYTGRLVFCYQEAREDSVYKTSINFAFTPEVIQKTEYADETSDLYDAVKDDPCTYLKTPAGLVTRATIPVDEMFVGEHSSDSISKMQLTFTRFNKSQTLGTTESPQYVALIREGEMGTFFSEHKIPDSRTSYLASFDENYNTYSFANISRLISYMRHEKNNIMKRDSLTSEEYNSKYPDWNKVCVVPVEIGTDANSNVTSCSHDLSLRSARLVGGKNNPIKVQVYYSKFKLSE